MNFDSCFGARPPVCTHGHLTAREYWSACTPFTTAVETPLCLQAEPMDHSHSSLFSSDMAVSVYGLGGAGYGWKAVATLF
eukprot:scaffold27245_cov18-Tisochrysis_lutea.AAC.1